MYRQHMPIIRDAMRADLEVFRRGCMFAVCSIRQPTINVPDQLGILFDGDEGENPLFGHKFMTYDYLLSSKGAALWREISGPLLYAGAGSKSQCEFVISRLLDVPGLGIVKAAFIAQLMGFDVACLDARNVAREDRNPRAYRTDGKNARQLAPKVRAYVAETFGKAEHYWDAWCEDVALAYDRTPEEISELHLAIVPRNYIPF